MSILWFSIAVNAVNISICMSYLRLEGGCDSIGRGLKTQVLTFSIVQHRQQLFLGKIMSKDYKNISASLFINFQDLRPILLESYQFFLTSPHKKMGPNASAQAKQKFQYLDGGDFEQSKYVPTYQQTSLESRKQQYAKSYQGPINGEVGQFTGLQEFIVPEKYLNHMKQHSLKCQKPNIQGHLGFDPYMFKKSLNVYFGQWKNAKPHGYGKIFNPDQDYYFQGYFQEGLPSYYGVFLTQGIKYEGQFKYGRASGQGKYTQGSKTIKGEFKQNYPSRNCIQKTQDHTFIGDYQNGCWSKGKLIWHNEEFEYEGNFRQGLMDGQGKLKFSEYSYEGSFRQGRKHGKGKLTWKSGEIYQGEFSNDEITGKGQLFKEKKLVYKGDFVKGKPDGQGWAVEQEILIHSRWKEGAVVELL